MKRRKDESYEDYKIRRKYDKFYIREYLKVQIFWDSNLYGTYYKDEHREKNSNY